MKYVQSATFGTLSMFKVYWYEALTLTTDGIICFIFPFKRVLVA